MAKIPGVIKPASRSKREISDHGGRKGLYQAEKRQAASSLDGMEKQWWDEEAVQKSVL